MQSRLILRHENNTCSSPLTNNGKIVFNSLIIYIFAFFQVGHGYVSVANARNGSSHSCCKALHGAQQISCSVGQVQHPAQRRELRQRRYKVDSSEKGGFTSLRKSRKDDSGNGFPDILRMELM